VSRDDFNLAFEKMASSEVVNGMRQEIHKLQSLTVTTKSEMEKKV